MMIGLSLSPLGAKSLRPGGTGLPAGAVLHLDPSDLSTLFQDAAGTVPVTAPGQPVALMLDKSGNDLHAAQSVNDNFRPTYQEDDGRGFLLFDGIDDTMLTPKLPFGAEFTNITAMRAISRTSSFMTVYANRSSGGGRSNGNHPRLFLDGRYTNRVDAMIGKTGVRTYAPGSVLGADIVVSSQISDGIVSLNCNGADVSKNSVEPLTDSSSAGVRFDRNGTPHMRFYGTAHYGRGLDAAEMAQARTYMATKSGGIA